MFSSVSILSQERLLSSAAASTSLLTKPDMQVVLSSACALLPRGRACTRHQRRTSRSIICRGRDPWKEVIDASSGKPYYWNTATNDTSWTRPSGRQEDGELPDSNSDEKDFLMFEDLLQHLLSADLDRFSAAVEPHRQQLFRDDAFNDSLDKAIKHEADFARREKLEKLRARLANPLLKNPQPFEMF